VGITVQCTHLDWYPSARPLHNDRGLYVGVNLWQWAADALETKNMLSPKSSEVIYIPFFLLRQSISECPTRNNWKILPIPIYARFRNGYNKCSMIFHSSKPTSRKRSSITSNGESSGRSSRSSRQSKSATHEHHTASTKLRGTNSPCYGLSIVSIWALDFLPSHSS